MTRPGQTNLQEFWIKHRDLAAITPALTRLLVGAWPSLAGQWPLSHSVSTSEARHRWYVEWSGLRGNYPSSEHWRGDEREDGETDKITGPHRSCVRSEGRQSRAIVMKTEHCWALVDRSEVCRIFAQIEMLTTDLTHQRFWFVLWLKDKPHKHAKLDLLWTERRKSKVRVL